MMPAFFLGHGNPMNAVSQNAYTKAWNAIGKSVPRPAAVLAISAHWYNAAPARQRQIRNIMIVSRWMKGARAAIVSIIVGLTALKNR